MIGIGILHIENRFLRKYEVAYFLMLAERRKWGEGLKWGGYPSTL